MRFCNNSEGGVGSSTTGFFDLRRKDMAKVDGEIKPIISFTSTDNVTTAPAVQLHPPCPRLFEIGRTLVAPTHPLARRAYARNISLQISRGRALQIIVRVKRLVYNKGACERGVDSLSWPSCLAMGGVAVMTPRPSSRRLRLLEDFTANETSLTPQHG